MDHVADRLQAAVAAKGTPLCVGLDPRWESLPLVLRASYAETLAGKAQAYEEFCQRILELVAPHVGVVKAQSAFFEACGPAGMLALLKTMQTAHRLGLFTILDAKRGDIASTAEAYAEAAFDVFAADAVTVSPYLGRDSIEPFLKAGRARQRGLFVLVRTSNPGAGQFQDLPCSGRPVHEHVAAAVQQWTRENLGVCGWGDVGGVVGATSPAELVRLREQMPQAPLLVPGYGVQGGSAADVAGAFDASGRGAVVNSSRGILFPYPPEEPHWEDAVLAALTRARAELPRLKSSEPSA
jgi:orotidine-5'-phosphate decarboxylase